MNLIKTGFLLLTIISINSCLLSNDCDINFLNSKNNIMVECYLVPNKNYQLSIVETNSLNDQLILNLLWNANVTISNHINTVKLINTIDMSSNNEYIYNYGHSTIVPKTATNYKLTIKTNDNQTIEAETKTVSEIKIIEAKILLNNVKIKLLNDPDSTSRYYSLLIEKYPKTLNKIYHHKYINATQIIEDTLNFSYKENYKNLDSVKVKVFHITKENYEFQNSKKACIDANADPFMIPEEIKSNVSNAIGIFTYYTTDETIIQIKK